MKTYPGILYIITYSVFKHSYHRRKYISANGDPVAISHREKRKTLAHGTTTFIVSCILVSEPKWWFWKSWKFSLSESIQIIIHVLYHDNARSHTSRITCDIYGLYVLPHLVALISRLTTFILKVKETFERPSLWFRCRDTDCCESDSTVHKSLSFFSTGCRSPLVEMCRWWLRD